ncbi:DUF1998 domain-containing protein [Arthrobacter stackebrandtii]|uniref:DUF1998 domain-containing protein n=1 Tax=Arthrobacter stackebrandtii TaxID=272161 RepID=UPI000D9DB70C|nr:hypothetical protein CVV67_16500 [Arthrobacter stackebrandtii]
MRKIKHDLRLSETLSPFGVGAIVDVLGESLIAPDTSWWDRQTAPEITCDRLVAQLGGGILRQAPSHAGRAGTDTTSLLYFRFPAWRFCERCGRLSQLTGTNKGKYQNKCACNGALVPMRYVAVCEKGSHIQDVPWFMWTHRGNDEGITAENRLCRAVSELRFERSSKHGEGLASLRVVCGKCNRSRSLTELVGKSSLLRDGVRCAGKQPWEPKNTVVTPCDSLLRAVQRGATGNYIADRVSALDIPEEKPKSQEIIEKVRTHDLYQRLVDDNGGPRSEQIAGWIAEELGASSESVLAIALSSNSESEPQLLDLKDGEWAAFIKKIESGRDNTAGDFVVDGWQSSQFTTGPVELHQALTGVGQVRRVREVRALRGFRRHSPQSEFIRADLDKDPKHRPAYPSLELFGEGIFLQFNEDVIAEWEAHPAVRARAGILIERRNHTEWAHRLDVPEPRFIALHTLAHILVRRLAFASGYSSASLSERIYANSERADNTAGILIYTAAGDAQGTLGGLVRLGAPKQLFPLLIAALNDADVCSNDPVCIESDRQGSSQLNLSACHGCALVSETSCETSNRLLDRQLLLGGSEVPGLLEAVLPSIRRSTPTLS